MANYDILYEDFYYFLFFFIIYFIIDRIMVVIDWMPKNTDPRGTGRYLSLHVLCNLYVTIVYLDDVFMTYYNPFTSATEGVCDRSGTIAILALHIYHIVFYRPLPWIDWVHHIVMIVVMLPMAYALQPSYLLGHGAWFASGLPGGKSLIIYLMLFFFNFFGFIFYYMVFFITHSQIF